MPMRCKVSPPRSGRHRRGWLFAGGARATDRRRGNRLAACLDTGQGGLRLGVRAVERRMKGGAQFAGEPCRIGRANDERRTIREPVAPSIAHAALIVAPTASSLIAASGEELEIRSVTLNKRSRSKAAHGSATARRADPTRKRAYANTYQSASNTVSPRPSTLNTAREPGAIETVTMRLPVMTTMPALRSRPRSAR